MSRRRKRLRDDSDPSTIAGRLRPLGFERYAEYLASDHWKGIKRRYRESDRPQRCECGAKGRHLHHLTYARLGAEQMADLELLCADCHRDRHGLTNKPKPRKPATPRGRNRKSPPPAVIPRHLRPLGGEVARPKPPPRETKRKKPKSRLKPGEPKPWEWSAGQNARVPAGRH